MLFSAADYLVHVEDFDMSEDRKIELIEVVAAIMQSCVDRAFGRAPEQILLGIDRENSGARVEAGLASRTSITSPFNDAGSEGLARKSPP